MDNLEDKFERAIERRIDALDARFMAGTITQFDYDLEFKKIRLAEDEFYSRYMARRY